MVPPVPAEAVIVLLDTPAWVTVNTVPAMVILAVRLAPVLEATVYLIVPLPVPEPVVTVIQEVLAEVLQLHPVWVVMATLPDPPEAEKEALEGDME